MHKQQLHQPQFCMAKVNLVSQGKYFRSIHLKSNVLQILKSFACQQDLTDEKLHSYLHATDGVWLFLEKHTQTHIRQDTNKPKKQFHASLTQSANQCIWATYRSRDDGQLPHPAQEYDSQQENHPAPLHSQHHLLCTLAITPPPKSHAAVAGLHDTG